MQVSFPCDPKRSAELIAASIAEIKKVADGDIDAKVFAQAQEILKKSWETSIQDNSYIAESYANSVVIYSSPLSRLDKRPGFYAAVTPKDVQAMTAQILKNAPIQIVLYPEGK
jgi:predicted Zn-dependent peptidase